jgi:hypothetical protein
MSRSLHVRGLPARGVAVAAAARVGGADRARTPVVALDPGVWLRPLPPPDPAVVDHLGRYAPGGEAAPNLSLISVTVSRASGPAPLGVSFQLRSPDPNWPSFVMFGTAVWSFSGNPGEGYVFRHLTEAFAGDRAGSAHGPYCGHVYVRPGRHAWLVTLHYPGLPSRTIVSTAAEAISGAAAEQITVHDPDAYFDDPASLGIAGDADRTVFFSPDAARHGDAAGLRAAVAAIYPRAAALPLARFVLGAASWKAAVDSACDKAGLPWRLLVEAGTVTEVTNTNRSANVNNLYVGRFGTGADPVLRTAPGFSVEGRLFIFDDKEARPFWITDLDCRGAYDPRAPGTGAKPQYGLYGFQLTGGQAVNGTIFRCRFNGFYNNVTFNYGRRGMVVADSNLDAWYNYGFWPDGRHREAAFVGLSIKQPAGTVNLGRKRMGSSETGSASETYLGSAHWTDPFDWALEAADGVPGPVPNTGAPAVPPGEAAPATGGWATVSAWWKANWAFFKWKPANAAAFSGMNDDLYVKAAIHGPIRQSTPSWTTAYHQIEMRSLNGWSTSKFYDNTRSDLEQVNPGAYAVQPCFRCITAIGSAAGEFAGHSMSLWRLATYGGNPGIQCKFQRDVEPTIDEWTLGHGLIFDTIVSTGLRGADFPTGGRDGGITLNMGRSVVRNSLIVSPAGLTGLPAPDETVGPGLNLRSLSSDPALSADRTDAPAYAYNNTFVQAQDAPLARYAGYQQDPGGRILYWWNNVELNYGRLAQPAALPVYAELGTRSAFLGETGLGHVPKAGSNIVGAARMMAPHHDAAGRARRTPPAIGAFEEEP